MNELSRFQLDILTVLAAKPRHGFGVKEELEHKYGTNVNVGRLYPNLETLIDRGLVDKEPRNGRTNEYTLTIDGRRRLKARVQFLHDNLTDDDTVPHDAVMPSGDG